MAAPPLRDQRIDALRGFALGGILLINIQSFLYGATHPLGYLEADAGALSVTTYLLTAAAVNLKFMPLFAMLFGVGFGLLYQKLQSMTDNPARLYRRRMMFLLVFGVLHGALLYFGDITHLYALAGLVLLRYADQQPRALARAAVTWWLFATIATGALFALVWRQAPVSADVAAEVARNFEIFANDGYVEQLPQRISAFADVIVAGLLHFPLTVALMITGMLAQRAGWFADRAAVAWTIALRIGLLVGLPSALLYGVWSLQEMQRNGLGAYSIEAMVPMTLSLPLAFAYAAWFVRNAPAGWLRWLAPAGRMPLTNYALQSVAMGVLLSGWGLSLGAQLGYAQLAALALAIYAVQLVVSRAWLAHWRQGPLEALWRQWTYRPLQNRANANR